MNEKIVYPKSITDRFILLGIVLGTLFWVLESGIHAFIFHEGSFFEQILPSDSNEVWMRVIVVCILIIFSVYAQFIINQRKRAEKEIRAKEENLAITLNSIGDAVIATDTEGRVVRMNPVAEKLTGWDFSEAEGRPLKEVFNIINEETRNRVKSPIERVLHEGIIVGLANHTILVSKDGTEFPIADSGAPIIDDKGDIMGVVLVFRDVTEKREAEKALQESEGRYRTAIEHSNDGVGILKEEKNVYVNQRFAEIFGYESPEEIIGKPLSLIVHPDDLAMVKEYASRRLKGESSPSRYEFKGIRKDGVTIDIEVSVALTTYFGEQVSLAYLRDISERKRAEDELRESENTFRAILDSVTESMFLIDTNYNILALNPTAAQRFGYNNRDQLLGKNILNLYPPEVDKRRKAKFEELINSGKPVRYVDEREGIHFDNSTYPLLDAEGKVARIAIFAHDITDQKRAEEEKKSLQDRLLQAQKMESIGTMAGGIAHDFNNILSPIMIHSEMGMMDLPPESPLQHNFREIFKAGERARDLVRQILTFSRMKEQERASIKISPILKEALKLLRSSLPTTIKIQQDIEVESDTILADPTQIHQVVMNLVTNAGHAMREKGGVLEVSLVDEYLDSEAISHFSHLPPGSYLRLTVSDTGHGVDPEVIDRIFEPYFTTKSPGEGTGMGLAVVHGIVKSYGGDINVQSKPGKGTTFHVLFPKIEAEISPVSEQVDDLPTGNERVLFVDDEKVAVDVIQSMLEHLGYKVTARTSSIEALEAFRNNPEAFDLVITDMTMPNMTGVDLARELMKIRSGIPIILCTGFSEQIDEGRAKEMGIRAFLMKPIVMHKIANTIREVLDTCRS